MNRFYKKDLRKNRLCCLILFIIIVIPLFATGFYYVNYTMKLEQGISLVLFGFLFCIPLFGSSFHKPECSIYPYFEEKLPNPGADTLFKGTLLAKHLDELDQLLQNSDIKTISSFGYKDGLNKDCNWYQASEGLLTFNTAHSIAPPEVSKEISADIDHIVNALNLAEKAGIRFCLHMRMTLGYSLKEFENREGSYT